MRGESPWSGAFAHVGSINTSTRAEVPDQGARGEAQSSSVELVSNRSSNY